MLGSAIIILDQHWQAETDGWLFSLCWVARAAPKFLIQKLLSKKNGGRDNSFFNIFNDIKFN